MIIVNNRTGAALVAAALALLVVVGVTRIARAAKTLDDVALPALAQVAPKSENPDATAHGRRLQLKPRG